jgi:hypothetical protein
LWELLGSETPPSSNDRNKLLDELISVVRSNKEQVILPDAKIISVLNDSQMTRTGKESLNLINVFSPTRSSVILAPHGEEGLADPNPQVISPIKLAKLNEKSAQTTIPGGSHDSVVRPVAMSEEALGKGDLVARDAPRTSRSGGARIGPSIHASGQIGGRSRRSRAGVTSTSRSSDSCTPPPSRLEERGGARKTPAQLQADSTRSTPAQLQADSTPCASARSTCTPTQGGRGSKPMRGGKRS